MREHMRAPFQILAIPYRKVEGTLLYCVFRRADSGQWQFIAGGGEDNETLLNAAKRETLEEAGVQFGKWMPLTSLCYLPVTVVAEKHRQHWNKDTLVIPEYAYAFECPDEVTLSNEHTEYAWLPYEEAMQKLQWDSNRTALYELNCRLEVNHVR